MSYVVERLKFFVALRLNSLEDEPAAYQVVGEIKAHQAFDGYPV